MYVSIAGPWDDEICLVARLDCLLTRPCADEQLVGRTGLGELPWLLNVVTTSLTLWQVVVITAGNEVARRG